jgi:hypothetical protein
LIPKRPVKGPKRFANWREKRKLFVVVNVVVLYDCGERGSLVVTKVSVIDVRPFGSLMSSIS